LRRGVLGLSSVRRTRGRRPIDVSADPAGRHAATANDAESTGSPGGARHRFLCRQHVIGAAFRPRRVLPGRRTARESVASDGMSSPTPSIRRVVDTAELTDPLLREATAVIDRLVIDGAALGWVNPPSLSQVRATLLDVATADPHDGCLVIATVDE